MFCYFFVLNYSVVTVTYAFVYALMFRLEQCMCRALYWYILVSISEKELFIFLGEMIPKLKSRQNKSQGDSSSSQSSASSTNKKKKGKKGKGKWPHSTLLVLIYLSPEMYQVALHYLTEIHIREILLRNTTWNPVRFIFMAYQYFLYSICALCLCLWMDRGYLLRELEDLKSDTKATSVQCCFSTHRKINSKARCEYLHLIKRDCQALWLDEISRSELAC